MNYIIFINLKKDQVNSVDKGKYLHNSDTIIISIQKSKKKHGLNKNKLFFLKCIRFMEINGLLLLSIWKEGKSFI
jgi:hypothetical protein